MYNKMAKGDFDMTTFGTRLKQLRLDGDLKQKELVEALKIKCGRTISVSMLSKWENGKEEPQKFSDVAMLATYFGVTGDYLIGQSDNKYGDDKEYIMLNVIDMDDIEGDSFPDTGIEYEPTKAQDGISYCLRVNDDSMVGARILEGDIVYVVRQSGILDKDIAVYKLDGDFIIRRVNYIRGGMLLIAENSAYEHEVILDKDKRDITLIGKVIYFKSKVR